jgi:type IV secretory pathway VirB2 component (pilin)
MRIGTEMNSMMNSTESLLDVAWTGILIVSAVIITAMLPIELWAGGGGTGTAVGFSTVANAGSGSGSSLDTLFCNVIGWFNGPIGKGIATIALIVVGVGALMGKVSWGMAIIVGIGVAIIFGATTLVDALGGAGSTDCDQGGMDGNKI